MPRPAGGWLFTFTRGCGRLWLWFNGCGAGWLWKSPAVKTSNFYCEPSLNSVVQSGYSVSSVRRQTAECPSGAAEGVLVRPGASGEWESAQIVSDESCQSVSRSSQGSSDLQRRRATVPGTAASRTGGVLAACDVPPTSGFCCKARSMERSQIDTAKRLRSETKARHLRNYRMQWR